MMMYGNYKQQQTLLYMMMYAHQFSAPVHQFIVHDYTSKLLLLLPLMRMQQNIEMVTQ
jgi:hypothetical protein